MSEGGISPFVLGAAHGSCLYGMKGAAKNVMTTTRGMATSAPFTGCWACIFFMHNPGPGLYLPFNAWGWIFASLVIAPRSVAGDALRQRLVILILAAGALAGALLLLLPMAYPGFWSLPGLRHPAPAGSLSPVCCSSSASTSGGWSCPARDRLSICCSGPSPSRRCSAWCNITC